MMLYYIVDIFLGKLCALGYFRDDLLVIVGNLEIVRQSAPELSSPASEFASDCYYLHSCFLLVMD